MRHRIPPPYRTGLALPLAMLLVAAFALPSIAAEAEYAGSKKSGVYHRLTCGHVQRIKPGNLLTFE